MESVLMTERHGSVAVLTMNRPDKANALNRELKEALLAAVRSCADDAGVRAVVLTGEGRAFCAGQDLADHPTDDYSKAAATVREHYNPIVRLLSEMPKPVVAAVGGVAAGAGAGLALAADFRLAADRASFLMAFSRVGLGPDTGVSWLLPRLIGSGRAVAMLMLAEPVDAEQALTMGLVNAVVPAAQLQAAALELAGRLANGPTAAFGGIKQAVAAAASLSLPEALELEADVQARLMLTTDHREAVASFLAKSPATFLGR